MRGTHLGLWSARGWYIYPWLLFEDINKRWITMYSLIVFLCIIGWIRF